MSWGDIVVFRESFTALTTATVKGAGGETGERSHWTALLAALTN